MELKTAKTNKMEINKKTENVVYLYPHGSSEPFVVMIIRSGWNASYHVITEWGDTGETTHKLMKSIEILNFYGIDGNDLPETDIICVNKKTILDNPNDGDLGALIRKKLF
jgi:hypothetical protein